MLKVSMRFLCFAIYAEWEDNR